MPGPGWAELDAEALGAEFAENGCVKIPGLLDKDELARCWRVHDTFVKKPHKMGAVFGFHNDASGYRGKLDDFKELVESLPSIGKALKAIWGPGCTNVWYYDHELFRKTWPPPVVRADQDFQGTPGYAGGEGYDRAGKRLPGRGTPYHQDTMDIPFKGPHIANVWISFEPVPQEHCLHVVKGSHNGPRYTDRNATTAAHAEAVKEEGRIFSTSLEPGDVLFVHPNAIHGNGTVSPDFPLRNTLALRYVGDGCWFYVLADPEMMKGKRWEGMQDGDPFSKIFGLVHVHGPGGAAHDTEMAAGGQPAAASPILAPAKL